MLPEAATATYGMLSKHLGMITIGPCLAGSVIFGGLLFRPTGAYVAHPIENIVGACCKVGEPLHLVRVLLQNVGSTHVRLVSWRPQGMSHLYQGRSGGHGNSGHPA